MNRLLTSVLATLLAAALLIPLNPVCAAATDESQDARIHALRGELRRAADDGRAEAALEAIERLQQIGGLHSADAMTAAVALAQLGRDDEADRTIAASIERGFVDIARLRSDPAFSALRRSGRMTELIEGARAELKRDADRFERALRNELGEHYRFAYDADRQILYAADLDEESFREMRKATERQFDYLTRELFGGPAPYVIRMIIPSPRDATKLLGSGDPMPTGRYEHPPRTVIARNTGSALRHEFVHALHYGHMERMGLRTAHPLWIQEGLATLFEHVEWSPDRGPLFLPNDRTQITNNLARRNRLMPWTELMEMSAQQFMMQPTRTYPEARSIFEFLASEGLLAEWYRALNEAFDKDATGRSAFEHAMQMPLADAERAYRDWARHRAEQTVERDSPELRLGTAFEPYRANDGVTIGRTTPGGSAARARLRAGDVIVSLDSVRVYEPEDLGRALTGREDGETLTFRVRRGDDYLEIPVQLAAPPRGSRPFGRTR